MPTFRLPSIFTASVSSRGLGEAFVYAAVFIAFSERVCPSLQESAFYISKYNMPNVQIHFYLSSVSNPLPHEHPPPPTQKKNPPPNTNYNNDKHWNLPCWMGAFHLPGLVTQMDTLQDAVNTQSTTIKAEHISINPHTFRHVLPIHGQDTNKTILTTTEFYAHQACSAPSFSFFLIPIHWYCSSSTVVILAYIYTWLVWMD